MDGPNPYASPIAQIETIHDGSNTEFVRGSKKGPALYIVLAAIAVTLVFALALQRFSIHEPIGLALLVIGCIVGATIYRFRSRDWPVDPSAKNRILKYSTISILTPPVIMFVATGGGRAEGAAMVVIYLIVGISVAAGIILSGSRRHGELKSIGQSENAG
jgi:peptidoglycan/LPS O-acetylase OafA/YrhL